MLFLEKAGILFPNLSVNCILEKACFYVNGGKYRVLFKERETEFCSICVPNFCHFKVLAYKDRFLKCCLSLDNFEYTALCYFNIDLFVGSCLTFFFSFLSPPPFRTVIWDKNNITAQGFQDIAVALEK